MAQPAIIVSAIAPFSSVVSIGNNDTDAAGRTVARPEDMAL
jgi:hypothetical protein